MENGFDNSGDDERGHGMLLVVLVLVASLAVHVGLLFTARDCSFLPMTMPLPQGHQKWTKEVPVMRMQKLAQDPLARDPRAAVRPVAAPEVESTSTRLDRLGEAVAREAVPDMPAAAPDVAAPSISAPAAVKATEWVPRPEILQIETPVVPDERAALPRVVIPKVPRAASAPDVIPAFDPITETLGRGNGLGKESSSAPLAGAAAGASAAAAGVAPSVAPPMPSFSAGIAGTVSAPATLAPVTLAEDRDGAAKRNRAAPKKTAVLTQPPPAPPAAAKVDVKVVAEEKQAVRALRDDKAVETEPILGRVDARLGVWRDPKNPGVKYFRVRLGARKENDLPVISKDIVFLLDASQSISNDRLKSGRNAVKEALQALNSGDRFNVVAFRDRFEYAFPETAWMPVTEQSMARVDEWLGKLSAHGQTDVFRTLKGVLAMPRDPARPVVALVITDGEATSGMTRSSEIISEFTALNGGLISVFMYGVKEKANDYLMDMLTRGSRGTWMKTTSLFRTRAASELPDFAKCFARPLLADVSVIFSATSRAEVYPLLVNNLTEGAPLELFGMCSAEQREIVFSVRGLNGRDVMESLFHLYFAEAETLDESLRTEWAQRRLYELVAAYTAQPKPVLLREMQAFAQANGLKVPYARELK